MSEPELTAPATTVTSETVSEEAAVKEVATTIPELSLAAAAVEEAKVDNAAMTENSGVEVTTAPDTAPEPLVNTDAKEASRPTSAVVVQHATNSASSRPTTANSRPKSSRVIHATVPAVQIDHDAIREITGNPVPSSVDSVAANNTVLDNASSGNVEITDVTQSEKVDDAIDKQTAHSNSTVQLAASKRVSLQDIMEMSEETASLEEISFFRLPISIVREDLPDSAPFLAWIAGTDSDASKAEPSDIKSVTELREKLAQVYDTDVTNLILTVDDQRLEDGEDLLFYRSKYFQRGFHPEDAASGVVQPAFQVKAVLKSQQKSRIVSTTELQDSIQDTPATEATAEIEKPFEEAPKDDYALAVSVPSEDPTKEPETIIVRVKREASASTFQGGYRHKLTGIEYHNAVVQTMKAEDTKGMEKFHRETQTAEVKTRSAQTAKEMGTQMARKDLYQDGAKFKEVEADADRYLPADQLLEIKEQKAIEIQCFIRQCFASRRVRRLRDVRHRQEEAEGKEREAKKMEDTEKQKREVDRRLHPRTKEDFLILYSELDAWRQFETNRIKNQSPDMFGLSPGLKFNHERRAYEQIIQKQLAELLQKEVKLLQTIDKLKKEAAILNREQSTMDKLKSMAAPKQWRAEGGDRSVQVETPFTMRARDLVEVYHGMGISDLNRVERVDLLSTIRIICQDYEDDLPKEILALVERELDLLHRGRSASSLAGLRSRLRNLFLRFCQNPMYNPEATSFSQTPTLALKSSSSENSRSSSRAESTH